jgi:hypothetical protein
VAIGRWAALLVGPLTLVPVACASGGDVRTYSGISQNVSIDGTGVLIDAGGGKTHTFVVGTGVEWRGVDNSWRDSGISDCLPPMSRGAEVTLTVTKFAGRDRVLRVECKSLPSELMWATGNAPVRCSMPTATRAKAP